MARPVLLFGAILDATVVRAGLAPGRMEEAGPEEEHGMPAEHEGRAVAAVRAAEERRAAALEERAVRESLWRGRTPESDAARTAPSPGQRKHPSRAHWVGLEYW
jgi:hypothetical protein